MNKNIPTARVITLTPAIATQLLARNPRNRKVSNRNYAIVLRAIQRGEWKLNGEAIKVDSDGFILDGQHRCLAVVDSGTPIQTFMIEGLEPDAQDTMDTGKSRGLADILSIRGHVNTAALAAIARRIYLFETHGLKAATQSSYPTTNHEVLAFFEANRWIESLVNDANRVASLAKMPASLAGLLMHVFQTLDRDDSAFFFYRLQTGENLESTSPIYALRRSLQALNESKGAIGQTYMAALAVKAWNKFRAGESVGMLKFTPGGANPEQFPEPK